MEERFNAERVFLNRLIDMHTHKNAEYQKIITTMSTDIINKNEQLVRSPAPPHVMRHAS